MNFRKNARHMAFASIAAAGLAWSSVPASAVEYKFGEATLSIDSIASTGITVRASKQDCMYISTMNGGCPDGIGQSANINTDDGNINFEQWDITNASVKLVSDVELRFKNFGAFTRLKAFYDHVIYDRAGEHGTDYGRRPTHDALRGDDSRMAGRGFDVLDAFVFTDFKLGEVPTAIRVGKQVINWGESLAIQGGINQFNSIDVGAIRTPGAELKEALLPEESIYVNFQLPADLSLEAFYAFNWRQTQLDPVGTFFSGVDIFGPGAGYVNTLAPEQPNPINAGTIPLAESDTPDKQGQFGVKLGHWASWLNQGTELALYFVNYHSKLPYVEYSNGLPPLVDGALPCAPCGAPPQLYRAAYPEDVKFVGTSFATTVEGTALAGEVLYSWNMPLQISSGELLAAHWIQNNLGLPVSVLPYDQTPGAFPRGYFEEDVINGQLSTITIMNPSTPVPQFLGADLSTFIVNWGFQYMPSISDARLSVTSGGRGSEISHPSRTIMHAPPPAGFFNPAQELVHADKFSHGYRLIGVVDYNNVFGTPWKLSPSIQWQHDLGTSAGTIGPGFLNARKVISLGVTADLGNVWRAEVRYTNSFGNKFQNYTQDRDFISMSVSYAF